MSEPLSPSSATRSDSSSGLSPVTPSPRSGLAALSSDAAGAAVSIFIACKVAPLLACGGQDSRWAWGLGALVLIAAPTSATQLLRFGRQLLTKR